MVLSRLGAATVGGYAVTYAVVAAAAKALPLPRVDAALLATFLAPPLFVAAVIWAFTGRRVAAIWGAYGLLSAGLLLALGRGS